MELLTLPLGPLGTNCYIATDTAGTAAIIDPGGDAEIVLQALATKGWRAGHILLTHAHFDHIGAVAELCSALNVPVALHALDLPLYRSGGGGRKYGLTFEVGPDPEVALDDVGTITVGATTFEVRFVPGHTVGHVAFYAPEAGAVFSGDVLFEDGIGRTDLPGGSYERLMLSIREQLLTLPDATAVYPGHGPATTIGRERQLNPFLAAD
ncbi:MAG TPA: MBL fold metallo-hydrolase [Anaerolineales bacterium]|nr:MBL fold metallo-hydrolase [Anaerolineales bacterium]